MSLIIGMFIDYVSSLLPCSFSKHRNQIEQLVTQVVPLFGLGNQQEFFDQLATRMMDEYQPSARPTAQRVRISLETLRVRNADPASEPKGGEAFACAGEPCSVCHDEFSAGVGVIELPCSHVS